MVKLWLPMNQFTVDYMGKKMDVIIPLTGDKSYDEYLEEGQRIITLEQLKKKEPKVPKYPKEHVRGLLKEFREWVERTDNGHNKRYF